MGKLLLICRLAARDLRHRRVEAVLLLLAITAATTTLTLGLALNGVISQPYQQTRAATKGPDVVASFLNLPPGPDVKAGIAGLRALQHEPGVVSHNGPFPVSWPVVRINGMTAGALAEGRDQAPAAIDQPKLVQGSWVRPGGVVIERSIAAALHASVGERLTLNGRRFIVTGIAVTAANSPYPNADFATLGGPFPTPECGMVWLTRADAESLATRILPLSYLMNLKLANPAAARAFDAAASSKPTFAPLALSSWQDIAAEDNTLVVNAQRALLVGSVLLGLLAVASVAVLVGGRLTEQTRRVGLLKAVGGTPKLVAAVLLAQNLALAVGATATGIALGWLAAPLLTSPGSGLVGTAGAPSLTATGAGLVGALALGVAVLATAVPAVRAARTSTVAALADSARPPRRRPWLIGLSRWLPVPLLLGLRIAGRRPRRLLLTAASVTITVTTIVAVLAVHAHTASRPRAGYSALANPRIDRVNEVLLVVTIVLVLLAAVNAVFITWATALDARHSAALARALGATADKITAGLVASLLLPAVIGAAAGIPAGIALVAGVSHGGVVTVPPAWNLLAVVVVALLALAALTAVPARIGARRSVAEILQSETA